MNGGSWPVRDTHRVELNVRNRGIAAAAVLGFGMHQAILGR